MMRIDVSAFLGDYPYRQLPDTHPEALLRAMDRTAIDEAWVSYLPAIFWRDPHDGNARLAAATAGSPRLHPVFAVQPALRHWEDTVAEAARQPVPLVRADPMYYGLDPAGPSMRALARCCGELGVVLLLTVRLEDGRQRHPLDSASPLPAAAVRALVRSDPRVHLIIAHADRPFVDEVHFGSTAEEAARLLWDISWIWGPPEDHLETLLRTVGSRRFAFGSGQPLRLPESPVAKLDLLDLSPAERAALDGEHARDFLASAARAVGSRRS